jgi:type IV pilus assembly protein PilE
MSGLSSRLSRHRSVHARGFSLIELLLVLALIGIISAIAIPSFLGQRRRARVIGDAQTNAKVLAMMLESRKAENGTYGTGGPFAWTATGTVPSASTNPAPSFAPKGNTKMNFAVAIGSSGLTYSLTARDPFAGDALVLTMDQSGAVTLDPAYNK